MSSSRSKVRRRNVVLLHPSAASLALLRRSDEGVDLQCLLRSHQRRRTLPLPVPQQLPHQKVVVYSKCFNNIDWRFAVREASVWVTETISPRHQASGLGTPLASAQPRRAGGSRSQYRRSRCRQGRPAISRAEIARAAGLALSAVERPRCRRRRRCRCCGCGGRQRSRRPSVGDTVDG